MKTVKGRKLSYHGAGAAIISREPSNQARGRARSHLVDVNPRSPPARAPLRGAGTRLGLQCRVEDAWRARSGAARGAEGGKCVRSFLSLLTRVTGGFIQRASPGEKRLRTELSFSIRDSVVFEDVAVDFTLEEWSLLDSVQKNLYRDVMLVSKSCDRFCESSEGNQHRDTCSHCPHLNSRKNISTGVKLYECTKCGNGFIHLSSLKRHVRSHCGQKPYPCQECKQAFICPTSLRTHTGEKPYGCKLCGKTFLYFCSLTQRIRIHTTEENNECKQCGKTFHEFSSLTRHMRTHTGEKPYKCKECGNAFIYPSIFQRHMITHTEAV
ncbi:zinc finger protein 709-like [Leopardus geoffroyi]|uniref:zinc finger protein 709-like n=1 Tax=Leopardus geoffroyi TaxID=46844 RepID=UPI001E25F119|nr:zinc finger protein 709-like [Leopardus geoffroyi]